MPAKKKKNVKTNDGEWIFPLIALILLTVLAYFAAVRLGTFGVYTGNFLSFLFGKAYLVVLLSLIFVSFHKLLLRKVLPLRPKFFVGLLIFNLAVFLLEGYLFPDIGDRYTLSEYIRTHFGLLGSSSTDFRAGILGHLFYYLLFLAFARRGALLALIVFFLIAVLLMTPDQVYAWLFGKAKDHHETAKKERQILREEKALQRQEAKRRSSFNDISADTKPVAASKATRKKYSTAFVDLSEKEKGHKTSAASLLKEKEEQQMVAPEVRKPDPVEKPVVRPAIVEKTEATDSRPSVTAEPVVLRGKYVLPPSSLLEKADGRQKEALQRNRQNAEEKGDMVIEILHNFGIEADLVNIHIGPTVTKFEVKPESGVKVNRIFSLQDNLKMELAVKDVRIEAPIPGRNAVGIEVPNVQSVPVNMIELIDSVPEKKKDSPLLFVLGKDLMGQGVYCELDRMPHLLIAGATGTGKSVCINAVIMSLIMRNHPDDVKLILIDPKKVEFTPYHDIPHLLWPVITDVAMASTLLQRVVAMMEERYDAFADTGVCNIAGYNDFVARHNAQRKADESEMRRMPYIVVIIDELADMMALAGKEVELSIQRITQLARASGIHLIVATQRPSTDVITGIIKANIPSRISLAVASSIDSRTILDQAGAERLLGNGDMLYSPQDESVPIRLQGVYVRDAEIQRVTSFLKKECQPTYDDAYFALLNSNRAGGDASHAQREEDPMLPEVIEYVRESQKASTSLLQRRFGIGYNRASRIIDALEEAGYIGPVNGSKPREVYLKKEEDEEE